MIKLVVLNIESIIFFEKEAVNNAFLAAFTHFGYQLTQAELAKIENQPFTLAIETLLHSQGISLAFISENYLKKIYKAFWKELLTSHLIPFQVLANPNIEELFADLQKNNFKIALYSDFSFEVTQLLIEKVNWQKYFLGKNIFCTKLYTQNLPAYFSIFQIMQRNDIHNVKEVAKIVTNPSDAKIANHAACGYVIGMSKSPLILQQLKQENCTHLIKHFEELYDIFALEE